MSTEGTTDRPAGQPASPPTPQSHHQVTTRTAAAQAEADAAELLDRTSGDTGDTPVWEQMDAAFGRSIPPLRHAPQRNLLSPSDAAEAGNRPRAPSATRRAVEAAAAYAAIDHQVPTASSQPLGRFIKRAVRAVTRFYVRHVTQQASSFNQKTVSVLDQLQTEQEELREAFLPQDEWFNQLRSASERPVGGQSDGQLGDQLVGRLCQLLTEAEGRVLVTDSAAEVLFDRLEASGVDCLGLVAAGGSPPLDDSGRDLRFGDPRTVLAALDDGCLGGALLVGFVDTASPSARLATVQQVVRACRPDAPLVIVTQSAETWSCTQGQLVVDLAPGRPFGASTWQQVLERFGCELIGIEHHGTPDDGSESVDATAGDAASGSGSPATFTVVVAKAPMPWRAARPADCAS